MAGIDEASARFVLAEMQDRLSRDPVAALGIATHATAEDVRTAFLQLTKQYHPVRFGRMALDIQKLANEVFLSLRAAHDAIAKAARPRRVLAPTTNVPAGHAPPLTGLPTSAPTALPSGAPTALPSGAPAALPSGAPAARSGQPAVAKTVRSTAPGDTGERPVLPAMPVTPPGGIKVTAARPAAQPPRTPGTARPVGSAAPVTPRDEAAVLDLLQRQQWDQARSALHQLTARDPSSKRIRALMCYARGREAQLAGRVDDARVELQDALDFAPELQVAKTALTELFTRRK